jgi:hypothetical protein
LYPKDGGRDYYSSRNGEDESLRVPDERAAVHEKDCKPGDFMKKIAVLVLAAIPVFAVAQKPDDVKQLKQENALLRIQVTGLQNALMQMQAQEAGKNLSEAHQKAIADLEALNPGKKWDEQQGKLVDKANAAK